MNTTGSRKRTEMNKVMKEAIYIPRYELVSLYAITLLMTAIAIWCAFKVMKTSEDAAYWRQEYINENMKHR